MHYFIPLLFYTRYSGTKSCLWQPNLIGLPHSPFAKFLYLSWIFCYLVKLLLRVLTFFFLSSFIGGLFQVRRVKHSDATLSAELKPYNIVPLEVPSLTNAIGFFPEVSWKHVL